MSGRMRRWIGSGLGLCLAMAAGVALADADTWYAQRLTGGDTPLRVEHFWSKGAKLRAVTVVGGFPLTTLVNGEFYYVIDTVRNSGIAVRRNKRAILDERKRSRPFGLEGVILQEQGAEAIREGNLAGRPCRVYRITDNQGRREAWITADALELPLRIEAFDRGSGLSVRTDYVDWARDLPLPDSFFEPPSEVKLERYEYDDFVAKSAEGLIGPAPILHSELLHGSR